MKKNVSEFCIRNLFPFIVSLIPGMGAAVGPFVKKGADKLADLVVTYFEKKDKSIKVDKNKLQTQLENAPENLDSESVKKILESSISGNGFKMMMKEMEGLSHQLESMVGEIKSELNAILRNWAETYGFDDLFPILRSLKEKMDELSSKFDAHQVQSQKDAERIEQCIKDNVKALLQERLSKEIDPLLRYIFQLAIDLQNFDSQDEQILEFTLRRIYLYLLEKNPKDALVMTKIGSTILKIVESSLVQTFPDIQEEDDGWRKYEGLIQLLIDLKTPYVEVTKGLEKYKKDPRRALAMLFLDRSLEYIENAITTNSTYIDAFAEKGLWYKVRASYADNDRERIILLNQGIEAAKKGSEMLLQGGESETEKKKISIHRIIYKLYEAKYSITKDPQDLTEMEKYQNKLTKVMKYLLESIKKFLGEGLGLAR